MSAQDAAALLPALARQALADRGGHAGRAGMAAVPDCLRRASGESLYIPHGAARYATGAQLTLEERLLAHAQETGAPRLAARRRGATARRRTGARSKRNSRRKHADPGAITRAHRLGAAPGSGRRRVPGADLRRRAEVMAGPAGSGKTRTVARDGPDLARGRDGRGDRPDHLPDRAQRPGRGGRDPRLQHRPVPRPPPRPPRGARAAAGRAAARC